METYDSIKKAAEAVSGQVLLARRTLHSSPELSFEERETSRYVANCLREAGIRTQVYLEQKKFKQKMSYADKLGIPYAVLLGEDELREGKCSVKDLATGEQVTVTPEEAARRIAQGMAEKNRGAVILEK